MKSERPHYRGTALPPEFVRPGSSDQLNFAQGFSVTGQRSTRSRKIFVIKKTSRMPSANAAAKKIRRILIFDNHPASLRLVFGHRLPQDVDLSESQSTGWWDLIIVSALTIGLLVGMFWPLL
jgi:hypothetical protein